MQTSSISLLVLLALLDNTALGDPPIPPAGSLSVAAFLPEGYVTDGSISYQPQIQQAIDAAAEGNRVLVFPPMVYLLEREAGLTIHSGQTFFLYGAVLRFDQENTEDGQAFLGQDVTDVQFLGGEIAGQRNAWDDGVNIAGIRITGNCARIRVRDMFLHDLSSNGIGVFGQAEAPIRDILVTSTIIRNCCNVYGDYLQPQRGPAKGSRREDQGGVAFYHVDHFLVQGCWLEDSRSDGTHFFQCQEGLFAENRVIGSQMGGYFLEGCRKVAASGNVFSGNGSRGVTIERDSRDCTLINNVIEHSGREGLWGPDITSCLVARNIFRENGRKDDGELDCEIKIEETSGYETVTEDIQIAGNLFHTTDNQTRAIWVTSGSRGIVVEGNVLRGPVRTIRADAWLSGQGDVVIRNNDGWKTDNAGVSRFDGDGRRICFEIPHGLDFSDPEDPRMLQHVRVVPSVTAGSRDAASPLIASADTRAIVVELSSPPPAGKGNVTFQWAVRLASPEE